MQKYVKQNTVKGKMTAPSSLGSVSQKTTAPGSATQPASHSTTHSQSQPQVVDGVNRLSSLTTTQQHQVHVQATDRYI